MRKVILLLTTFLFILSLSGCSKSNVILEGNVFESFKNTTLQGMEIVVDGKKTKTDESGHFKIEDLKKGSIEIIIAGSDKFEDFKDKLILDEGINRRDFFLEAKHPLNIPASEIIEPNSYAYTIFIGLNPNEPLVEAEVKSSKLDSALSIKGKEYDKNGNISSLEVIQIGPNAWIKDEYGNWNTLQSPGESVFRINSIFNEKYYPALNFFRDPDIVFKDTGEEVIIDNIKTRKFSISYKESDSGFVDNLEIFVIEEGEDKGIIKKIISNSSMRSMYPYIEINLSKFNEDLGIMPPAITQ